MPPRTPKVITTDGSTEKSINADMIEDGVIGDILGIETSVTQPSKDFGNIYQNQTTRLLLLTISGHVDLPAQNDAISPQLLVDDTSPPTPIAWEEDYTNGNLASMRMGFMCVHVVLPNQFYKLNKDAITGTGDATVDAWNETIL